MRVLALYPLSICGLSINEWHMRAAGSFTAVVKNQSKPLLHEAIQALGFIGMRFPIAGELDKELIAAQIEDVRFLSTGEGIEIEGYFVTDPIASSNLADIDGTIF